MRVEGAGQQPAAGAIEMPVGPRRILSTAQEDDAPAGDAHRAGRRLPFHDELAGDDEIESSVHA
jgi:hypothetical protein